MRKIWATVVFGLLGPSSCFKPALPREDAVDTTADSQDDGADGSGDVEAPSPCVSDLECRQLDDVCMRGVCAPSGFCESRAVSEKACDDGEPCTRDDICSEGRCKGEAFTCDDGLSCTVDVCDGRGGCSFPVSVGSCLIDGSCHDLGTLHPTLACKACEGGRSWSPVDGGPCDDEDTCTLETTCDAGTCAGGRLPDDVPGDFMRVFARAEQPIHELELVGLVPRTVGGVYATLRLRGTVILDGELRFGSPDTAHLIVALDDNGKADGAWAITGGSQPTVLGDDLAGRLVWSSACLPCSITQLGSETSITPETDSDHPAVLVKASTDGALAANPLSHAPQAKDALDQLYLRVMVVGEDVIVRGEPGHSITLSSGDAAASAWLVQLSNTLSPQTINGVYFAPQTPTFWPEFDIDAGPLKVMPDGRIIFPVVAAPGNLSTQHPGESTEVSSNSLLLAVQKPDVGMILMPVLAQLDNPLGFGLLAYADSSLDGDRLTVAGRFAGREVVFGGSQGPRTYQSSQHWGLEGSGNFGAGSEGFIVRIESGVTTWLRTLRPLGHPEAWGIAGSATYAVSRSQSGWLIGARLGGFGAWAGLGAPLAVSGPSSTAPDHAVFAELSEQGELLWVSSSEAVPGLDQAGGVVVSSGERAYLAGRLLPGTSGVGPTRIVDPDLEVPTPRVYIQRFNSAGGLTCGAGP